MSRSQEWASLGTPSPQPFFPTSRNSCLAVLINTWVLSFQRAAGPGHRDGVGHRHVLPFPAIEVHEDGLAAAGKVRYGGVWLGIGQSEVCVNWGGGASAWVKGVTSVYLDIETLLAPGI